MTGCKKRQRLLAVISAALLFPAICGHAGAEDLRGPEAWLEFMGGNVRTDGLRCDLEAIKGAGFSGVHFFHINHGKKGAWPDCPVQIPCIHITVHSSFIS